MTSSSGLDISVGGGRKVSSKKVKLPDTDLILEKNIFKAQVGSAQADITSNNAESSVPVSTTFNGVLLGVLEGDGKEMAVISYNDKKYILLKDVEQDGLTLIETGFYHAVIKQGNKEHKLILAPSDNKNIKNMTKSTPFKERVPVKGTTGSHNYKISRKEVVDNLSDVNEVIKSILIVPYEVNGEFQGYRVRRMTRNSILMKLGINRNDVIMRLNGKSLETPSVFFDTLNNAKNLSAVTIDLLRGRDRITNYVEIEG